ncbi:hypothetical protein [Enhygromyxa salina]|nr:hypothetical protein [Enhygromyxa salina]
MFSSIGCIAMLALFAGGCDPDELASEVDRSAALDVDVATADASTADNPPLVSPGPDQIDGISPVGFDDERQLWLYDRDGDGFPDLTEALDDTDMLDPNSNPAVDDELDALDPVAAAFPQSNCRKGFQQAGPRLCISKQLRPARRFRRAINNCRRRSSSVCSYEDLTYLYLNSDLDEDYNPRNKWIGNITGDNYVLCGNRRISYDGDPDWVDFEDTCHKNEKHPFWCCHDDDRGKNDEDDYDEEYDD